MESITVGYSRKTFKDYESFGVSGSVEFKPTTEDMQKEIDQTLLALKLILDPRLEEFAGKSGGVLEDGLPDLGPEPEWVGKNQARTDELLGRSQPAPPPAAPPTSQQSDTASPTANADQASQTSVPGTDQSARQPVSPTPASSPANKAAGGNIAGTDVYLKRAKVFRVNVKRSKTGNAYVDMRVGHDDLAAYGFAEHYVTVRIFDPQYVAAVGSLTKVRVEETGEVQDIEQLIVNKGDFVDLWGTFSPWKTDSTKFDINGTAIQKVA